MEVPPPGYVPPKRSRRARRMGLTAAEVVRTAGKLVDGHNKAASLQALAGIAQEVRKLIRG